MCSLGQSLDSINGWLFSIVLWNILTWAAPFETEFFFDDETWMRARFLDVGVNEK